MSKVVQFNKFCQPLNAVDNVQGSFQFCRKTRVGKMTLTCEEGEAEVNLADELISILLQFLPESDVA